MLGERGGRTATLDAGVALIEQHKPNLADSIRQDILDWLEDHSTWHRDNLRIEVPADSKNAVGAVVNGLIRSGLITETGERRKSSDPASHGRKSGVYRLVKPRVVSFPRAAQAGMDEPGAEPATSRVGRPQQDHDPAGGADNSLASPAGRLFDIQTMEAA